jgi:hypothetical protein
MASATTTTASTAARFALLACAACRVAPSEPSRTVAAEAHVVASAAPAPGAERERARGQNPLLALERARTGEHVFSGAVEERLRAGSYAYLRVNPGDGEPRWVVTLGAGPEPGTPVRVRSMGTRSDFRSKRLERTFDTLVFGIVSSLEEESR